MNRPRRPLEGVSADNDEVWGPGKRGVSKTADGPVKVSGRGLFSRRARRARGGARTAAHVRGVAMLLGGAAAWANGSKEGGLNHGGCYEASRSARRCFGRACRRGKGGGYRRSDGSGMWGCLTAGLQCREATLSPVACEPSGDHRQAPTNISGRRPLRVLREAS